MDQTQRCVCGRPDETPMVFFGVSVSDHQEQSWQDLWTGEAGGTFRVRHSHHQQGQEAACSDQLGSTCVETSAPTLIQFRLPYKKLESSIHSVWRFLQLQDYQFFFTTISKQCHLSFSVIVQQKPKVFVWFDHHYVSSKLKKDVNAHIVW